MKAEGLKVRDCVYLSYGALFLTRGQCSADVGGVERMGNLKSPVFGLIGSAASLRVVLLGELCACTMFMPHVVEVGQEPAMTNYCIWLAGKYQSHCIFKGSS